MIHIFVIKNTKETIRRPNAWKNSYDIELCTELKFFKWHSENVITDSNRVYNYQGELLG